MMCRSDLIVSLKDKVTWQNVEIQELNKLNLQLIDALTSWDALIVHEYSGSREAMSEMQKCAFDTLDLLNNLPPENEL